jgi:predicted permease
MKTLRAWLWRMAGVFSREQREMELAEEIECNLLMHIDDNLRAGMDAEEARRQALIKLGGITLTQESYRDHLRFPLLETLSEDLRYGVRMLRKSPVFTMVAFLTLILGIGANTAIFTLTYNLFLRGISVPRPNELALISYETRKFCLPLSLEMTNAIRQSQHVFTGILAWAGDSFHVSDNGAVEVVDAAVVNGDGFSTLGLTPAMGRFIASSDDHPGGGSEGWVAVISYKYWQEHFHGDPTTLGRSLNVESLQLTIVGVLPAGFESVNVGLHPSIVVPVEFKIFLARKSGRSLARGDLIFTTIGRMKPGLNLANARAEVARISGSVIQANLPQVYREVFFPGARLSVSSGENGNSPVRDSYRQSLLILQTLVGVILLLCCINLAGLFSARAAARRRDLTLRCALGAQRFRLSRQLFTEVLLIAVPATACALLLARLLANALIAAMEVRSYHLVVETRPDVSIFVFNAATALVAVLIAGLIPAMQATRGHGFTGPQEFQTPAANSKSGTRTRSWLVPMQAGISVVLVATAGLFAGTLYRLLTVDLGFDPKGVLVVPTDFQNRREKAEQRLTLYARLLDRLNSMPGIQIASAETVPVLRGIRSNMHFAALGLHGEEHKNINISSNRVGRRYFDVMHTRVLEGHSFRSEDEHSKHRVCILNRSAAHRLFPERNAIGSYLDGEDQKGNLIPYEIVGIVENTKFTNLRDPDPDQVYLAFQPGDVEAELSLVIKTDNKDAAIASARNAFREVVPDSPFLEPITEIAQLRESVVQERVVATISALFGLLAMLLTAIGVYGTLAFQVAQRTVEIGVRLALGAPRSGVLRMVLKQALLPLGIGALLGTLTALASSRLVVNLLYEIRPYSPAIYIGTLIIVGSIGFLAAWLPARRAASLDPVIALRAE